MNNRQLAQTLTFPDGTSIQGPSGFGSNAPNGLLTIGDIISAIIPYIFFFAGTAMLLMLIMGGFTLLTGASDPKRIDQGKQQITYAIVGFILVFLAYWVVQLARRIFGLSEFTIFG
jgi:hypothetical protein